MFYLIDKIGKDFVVNKDSDSVLNVDGKRMEWKFSLPEKKKSISKGILYGRDYYQELENAYNNSEYYNDDGLFKTITYSHKEKNGSVTKYNIRFMKVDRKTEPGKFFYVMISNLNVKLDTACWAYGQTEYIPYEHNAAKYGRLYTWDAANALAKKISTKLYKYDKNNPKIKKSSVRLNVRARLLSQQDVLDIIERDHVGYKEYTIDDNDDPDYDDGILEMGFHYYDVFLGGIDGPASNETIDYSRGLISLGGFRNTEDNKYYLNNRYLSLNESGMFWLKEAGIPTTDYYELHQTFEVLYNNDYNYTAFINVGHLNQYGMSVRYVLEPIYN